MQPRRSIRKRTTRIDSRPRSETRIFPGSGLEFVLRRGLETPFCLSPAARSSGVPLSFPNRLNIARLITVSNVLAGAVLVVGQASA